MRCACVLLLAALLSSCSLLAVPGQGQAPTSVPIATLAPPTPTAIALESELVVDAGGFRLRYPAGWASRIVSGTLTLAPSETGLARTSPGPDLVVTIDSTPLSLVAAQFGADATGDPQIFFDISSGAAQEAGYSLSATAPLTVDGKPGLAANLSAPGGAGRLVVLLTDTSAVRILGQASPEGWASQGELFATIVHSLGFFAPVLLPTPTPEGLAEQPDRVRRGPPGFLLRVGGSSGPRGGRFVSARGLAAAPDGTLYLAESSRGVWVFAPTGELITTFGADQLLDAYDIARAPSGDLFVADYGRNAVARFRPDGTFVGRWGSAGDGPEQFGLSSPQRIALGPNGDLYALDSRPGEEGRVVTSVMRFSTSGELVARIAIPADLAPADLAVDSTGNLYLAETFGGAVVKLGPDGAELARFGDPAAPQSLAAGALDIDQQGNIYVATYASGVLKLAPNGVVLARGGGTAAPGSMPGPGEFSLPNGIVAAPGGVVWVSDNSGEYSAVSALRLSADPTAAVAMTAMAATAVAAATPLPDTDLLRQWAAEATASSFYEIAPNDPQANYDPAGATGAPDVPGCQDSPDAWASADPNGLETLELRFRRPVFATGLVVYQNHQPGYISQIELIDERGESTRVYSGAPALSDSCPLLLQLDVPQSLSRVVAVRLTLDQRAGANWSEVDAVELVGLP